jgi:molybdopterin molybdotransferase
VVDASSRQPAARGREFFTTRTVAAALRDLPGRAVTGEETVPLDEACGRVPSRDVTAPQPLPGFARSTVDGFAVRAADTYGASEGLPSYLEIVGAVLMGAAPEVTVATGRAAAMPTGGPLPPGADAVVMVEHTQETMPGSIEVLRPVAPGEGVVRADEDVAVGAVLAPAGRPLRAQDLGLLAAAGVTGVPVRRRPRVAVVATGDEVVTPGTAVLQPGQVRDATSSALAALVREAGGDPTLVGPVRDEPGALAGVLRGLLGHCDVVVVSAGSSVGARDETAAAVSTLGEPGVLWHGLALRPGKPALLADCAGVPVLGLPGNPLSALVVFRLVGMPLVRRVAGVTAATPEPTVRAILARAVPSAAGRLDVVQVQLSGGVAEPVFGASALLSVLTRADGYLLVPEPATGLDAGAEVEVVPYR